MPYFNRKIHVYNQSILWSPLKNRMPKNLITANVWHLVSESRLRPIILATRCAP